MKEKYPVSADNVTMEDRRTGVRLKGVLIRPEIEGETVGEKMKYRFVNGSYYVVSSGKTESGEAMDTIVEEERYQKIRAGDEMVLTSHLTKRIDTDWTINRALDNVRSSGDW